jgi:hypothetical protein
MYYSDFRFGNRASHCRSSFRDTPLGVGPESILTMVVMDSGLALRAPRNDKTQLLMSADQVFSICLTTEAGIGM